MGKKTPTVEERAAKNIRELRGDMTLADMVKGSGISQRAITMWEKAKRLPTGKSLSRLCKFFKVTPDAILK